ncbi:jg24433, partial [Pararge aegeria aegeria]
MKGLLIILAIAVTGTHVSADFSPGLKVKFGLGNPWSGTDFFVGIPRNIDQAIEKGYEYTETPEGVYDGLSLYCPNGRTKSDIGVLFDTGTSNIAGIMIIFDKKRFSNDIFDWKTQGYRSSSLITDDGDDYEFYWTAMYFVSEEHLNKPVEERIAIRSQNDEILPEGALFVTGFDQKIDRISVMEDDIKQSIFTEQACIPWMGRHHYYNMSETTTCEADTMYPWFPLTANNKMVGIGHICFGNYAVDEVSFDWFEKPTKPAVQ